MGFWCLFLIWGNSKPPITQSNGQLDALSLWVCGSGHPQGKYLQVSLLLESFTYLKF